MKLSGIGRALVHGTLYIFNLFFEVHTLTYIFYFRISKEDHDAYIATLNKEQADLEKALATSADEHKKLLAAKQTQEKLLVEHPTHLNINTESKGKSFSLQLFWEKDFEFRGDNIRDYIIRDNRKSHKL